MAAAVKLCLLTSEMMPFAKTGGLADVTGALVPAFHALDHDVRAFMPLYRAVRAGPWEFRGVEAAQRVRIAVGAEYYEFSLVSAVWPDGDFDAYFVDCPAMFDRDELYTQDSDEYRRFMLFTRAVIESCQRLAFAPAIFHCNDWHTALLPLLLKTAYAWDGLFAESRSVLTIHNIGYQGIMPAGAAAELGLDAGDEHLDAADLALGFISSLKSGIRHADAVTTVSPTYAREIRDTPLGMGMQEALRARADGVTGILNGVDYGEWDPRNDRNLKAHFDSSDLRGKAANKRALTRVKQLNLAAVSPLLSMVTRLTEQKGIELLFDALPRLLEQRDCGLIVLGSGAQLYADFFESLVDRFPGRAAFHDGYDESLAHLIEAGSDIFLMPSRYEPCGLNQMYSLRYGTIPIVHRTGGLADSVTHFDPLTGTGTGCVFNDFDAYAAEWALNTTLDWFADRSLWRRLMQNAMAQDFSWTRRVREYEALFRGVARLARRHTSGAAQGAGASNA